MTIVMADNVQWEYTVTVTNRTTDVFDNIVIFYATKGQTGVTFLESGTVGPGGVIVFRLGPCGAMRSYTMGVMIGQDMVAKLPDQGEMDRDLASQMNPTDHFICEDSWSIEG